MIYLEFKNKDFNIKLKGQKDLDRSAPFPLQMILFQVILISLLQECRLDYGG